MQVRAATFEEYTVEFAVTTEATVEPNFGEKVKKRVFVDWSTLSRWLASSRTP